MKKLFVNPEVKSIELTPANNVMADMFITSVEVKSNTTTFADEVCSDYKNWQGRR